MPPSVPLCGQRFVTFSGPAADAPKAWIPVASAALMAAIKYYSQPAEAPSIAPRLPEPPDSFTQEIMKGVAPDKPK